MIRKAFFVSLIGLLTVPLHAFEQENDTVKEKQVLDLDEITLKDDPFVAQLDSLLSLRLFAEDTNDIFTVRKDEEGLEKPDVLPEFHDSIYEKRVKSLDELTPFELDYNVEVKRYIHVYANKRREQVSRMLGLSAYYFPMFEEVLDRYDLPLELKYLAIVESALNPTARSRVGAAGIWQFMFGTARLQGLKVSSYIDERHDPFRSTEAACKYLSQLYSIFGDWNLALAAYNSGPGNVSKAIRRSGGKRTYWEIRPYLPRETRGYVPAFIAVNYIMNHAEDHLIYPRSVMPSYFQTDTVYIREKVSFDQIAKLTGIDKDEIRFLNPAYRHQIIPKVESNPCKLVLPASRMGVFISHEDSIYKLAAADFKRKEVKLPTYVELDQRIRHKVRRGEVLGTIAEKYGVSVSSIRRWNGLRGNTIRIGQRLNIYPRKLPSTSTASTSSSTSKKSQATPSPKGDYVTYTVRNGETFYSIARKYPGISAENIMKWNNIRNAKRLKPGMDLKIYTDI